MNKNNLLSHATFQIKLNEWLQGQRTGVDLRVNEDPADPQQPFGEFKNGTWYHTLFLIFVLGLFTLPILNAWYGSFYLFTIQTSYSALFGTIPYSDAAGYYLGSQDFLTTGLLNEWNSRRPLNALFYAARSLMTGQSFHVALLLQAIVCGLAAFITSLALRPYCSPLGRAFFLLGIVGIYGQVFLPTTLSESLGLTLGFISCASFILFMKKPTAALFALSMFMLLVALNTRAGPFFLIPFLMIWGIYKVSPDRTEQIKLVAFSILGLLLALGYNKALLFLYTPADAPGAMHANFSHTLYGLVCGGKMWSYAQTVFTDFKGTEGEYCQMLYKESWSVFKEKPWLIILGILKNLGSMMNYFIGFLKMVVPFESMASRILGYGISSSLLFASIWGLWKRRQENWALTYFIIAVWLGFIASAAIVWRDGGFRTFAVSVPFIAISFVYGLGYFVQKFNGLKTDQESSNSGPLKANILLFAFITLSVFTLHFRAIPQEDQKVGTLTQTEDGPTIKMSHLDDYAYVTIDPTLKEDKRRLLYLSKERALTLMKKGLIEQEVIHTNLLNSFTQPTTLVYFYDQKIRNGRLLVLPQEVFLKATGSQVLEARFKKVDEFWVYIPG